MDKEMVYALCGASGWGLSLLWTLLLHLDKLQRRLVSRRNSMVKKKGAQRVYSPRSLKNLRFEQ